MAQAQPLYTPLKSWQTRVLRLHPGTGHEPLQGELFVANIVDMNGLVPRDVDEHLQYEAISYAWGEPVLTEIVVIGGGERAITPTLQRYCTPETGLIPERGLLMI